MGARARRQHLETLLKRPNRRQMPLAQVHHVQIVPHARAVLGRVVRAEDRQGLALAHRHLTVGKAAPFGAVVVPGAAAPKLISRDQLRTMQAGAVLVDVAIDQGGCFETSRPTTHDDPTYIVDDIVHYCVANMPGSVPRTSSEALNNATLPYVLALADNGLAAVQADSHLAAGVNVRDVKLVHPAVIEALAHLSAAE